jgi:hypothetical protein
MTPIMLVTVMKLTNLCALLYVFGIPVELSLLKLYLISTETTMMVHQKNTFSDLVARGKLS